MNFKELREKHKLSQTALAKALGVSTATVSAVENGRMKISQKLAETVKSVYGEAVEAKEEKKPVKAKTRKKAVEETKVEKTVKKTPRTAKKAAAKKPVVLIQSPMGGEITPEAILEKVGEVDTVYVRVDENKAYWVKGEETGSVELW